MGDIKKQHKKYSRPRKPFEKARIESENRTLAQYGLKNKQEIWRANTYINNLRRQAKLFINSPESEDAQKFLTKIQKIGFKVNEIQDILGLSVNDILERRLQTIVFKKGISTTMKQARQLIVHRKISLNNRIVNSPSMIILKELENSINIKK